MSSPNLILDRVRGCLLAGAVGDALGAPIELMPIEEIRERFGPAGVTDLEPCYGRAGGAITDDTQLTLFTLEGLLGAGSREAALVGVLHAYLRWLHTQGVPWQQAGATLPDAGQPGGLLVRVPELYSQRAPGDTCLSALHAAAAGIAGTAEQPINDSKGCGGVVRAAPAGFFSSGVAESFRVGRDVAALTHGHPSGHLPAGVLAAMVSQLIRGATLADALDRALAELRRYPGHEETEQAVAAARALAARGRPGPEDLETLGGGWTGEEALAVALCAALSGRDLADAVLLAVNHSGDSDSTGALCGNLLGARDGATVIPTYWLDVLELRDLIEALAADAAAQILTAEAKG
jgi:ADP-ribosylglycohydrolase